MATEDAIIAEILYYYVIPLAVCIVLMIVTAHNFHWWYQYLFALVWSRFLSDLVGEAIVQSKELLFADLPNIQSLDWELKNKGLIRILEIGCGSGANFEYYPKNCRLVCYDPNPYFRTYLFDNAEDFPEVKLERLVVSGGEKLVGTANESVDVVVTTLVLCSVTDVKAVLNEVKRVLPQGGKYYFLEHVRAPPGTLAYRLQRLVSPIWWRVCHCSLDRDIGAFIEDAGFSDVQIQYFEMDIFSPLKELTGFCVMGVLTK